MLTASYVFKNILRCFENCCNSQQFYNVYLEVSKSLYYSMWIFQIKKKNKKKRGILELLKYQEDKIEGIDGEIK